MTHHDHSPRARIGRELYGSGHVETTRIEIIRSSIRDPKNRNTHRRPCVTELLIQAVGRAEQPAHGATAGNDRRGLRRLTSRNLMPQDRDQAPHGEQLDVAKCPGDHRTLRSHDVEGVKRWFHRLYPTKPMATPRPSTFDLDDPAHREVALRIGRSWRELRRGASMSALVDYLFGAGDDALESGQMDTLDVLVQQPAWRMGDLADALRVDPSTATRAVQRLERVGLATRCVNPSDRRVVMVSATDHGHHRHAEAHMRRQTVMRSIMSSFEDSEREQLATYLERFIDALDTVVADIDRRDLQQD